MAYGLYYSVDYGPDYTVPTLCCKVLCGKVLRSQNTPACIRDVLISDIPERGCAYPHPGLPQRCKQRGTPTSHFARKDPLNKTSFEAPDSDSKRRMCKCALQARAPPRRVGVWTRGGPRTRRAKMGWFCKGGVLLETLPSASPPEPPSKMPRRLYPFRPHFRRPRRCRRRSPRSACMERLGLHYYYYYYYYYYYNLQGYSFLRCSSA